jgi:hypothetical protein
MNCTVCGKAGTLEGTNVCSNSCLMTIRHNGVKLEDAVNNRGKVSKTGHAPSSVGTLTQKLQNMAQEETPVPNEVPMLKVKHPWMRNRVVVSGITVLAFDDTCTATVKDLHPAKEDIAALMKKSPAYTWASDEVVQPLPVIMAQPIVVEPPVEVLPLAEVEGEAEDSATEDGPVAVKRRRRVKVTKE